MPEPDCFLRYRICAATQNFTSAKSRRAATASRGFKMALFTEASGHLFGGKCALPSVLLVCREKFSRIKCPDPKRVWKFYPTGAWWLSLDSLLDVAVPEWSIRCIGLIV